MEQRRLTNEFIKQNVNDIDSSILGPSHTQASPWVCTTTAAVGPAMTQNACIWFAVILRARDFRENNMFRQVAMSKPIILIVVLVKLVGIRSIAKQRVAYQPALVDVQ
jgi:hypothetical protein